MISISIISPLKSMAVIDKAIEHNDFGCVFHKYVYESLEEIKDIYDQCKTSRMSSSSPVSSDIPIF